jgi:hypothetical protein
MGHVLVSRVDWPLLLGLLYVRVRLYTVGEESQAGVHSGVV